MRILSVRGDIYTKMRIIHWRRGLVTSVKREAMERQSDEKSGNWKSLKLNEKQTLQDTYLLGAHFSIFPINRDYFLLMSLMKWILDVSCWMVLFIGSHLNDIPSWISLMPGIAGSPAGRGADHHPCLTLTRLLPAPAEA